MGQALAEQQENSHLGWPDHIGMDLNKVDIENSGKKLLPGT